LEAVIKHQELIAVEFYADKPTGNKLEAETRGQLLQLIPKKTKPNYWKIFLVEGSEQTPVGGKIIR